jgi:membrane protease YdiL (CAAX protease family)
VLIGLMLFLPLLDRAWKLPDISRDEQRWGISIGLFLSGTALLIWKPEYLSFGIAALFLAALPEEWFFRAYFMTRLGRGWRANLIASLLFSLLHGLTRGWTAAVLVFLPSLFYGWLFQRTRDLPLLVLVHALSNIVYALFLARFVATWAPDLR